MRCSYGTNIGTAGSEYTGTGVENNPCSIPVSTGNRFLGKGSGNIRVFSENFFRDTVEKRTQSDTI
jgi:hypothetical protein